ncbi:cache domain-containing protein [Paeniglutamicibacter terrestris]|uniref:GntR family transcriptional regulator n=1 Tax=Paeniglutamicibacter terrestris TaxID=2723403 RepID=A0ABX1G625_9MICC|nr:cache domain-containing protein [Paeniglutamicibacter terrestris]ASN40386.1 GntR family transcriptional regulator [Arthrobacter sp. 7749]NKG21718.1 GntR family transcriptional regulator [Paeniglutamicibacter terrestris]
MSLSLPAAAALGSISAWFNEASAATCAMAAAVTELLTHDLAPGSLVTKSDLAGLKALASDSLRRHPYAVGSGATFSSARMSEGQGVLEWWAPGPNGAEKLAFDLDPGGERFYDYEHLPYFSDAERTGEVTIWGPYVDYLGSDEYILTHTAPFKIHGEFAGVAGYDVTVRALEEIFLPALRSIPGHAALLNSSHRVIIGNSGAYLVGERIKAAPSESRIIPLEVPHLGLSMLVPA